MITFMKGVAKNDFRLSKSSAETSDNFKPQSKKGKSNSKIIPEMRCKMETIAGIGNRIVHKFKFIGLCLFTVAVYL